MARVLAVSSHVARGHVGLAANVPALQWLGHEVWTVPTVLLSSRPGLGKLVRRELPPADLAAMLAAFEGDGCWGTLDAVLTGYFPGPASVSAAAEAVRHLKQANARTLVLVDPILGDAGRLYVAEATAAAIRDELLPLADIATPNLFELEWLSGMPTGSDAIELARALGPPSVAVTSAAEARGEVITLLVDQSNAIERRLTRREGIPNGAGDLFAGLLLGHLLNGHAPETALEESLEALDRVLAASSGHDVLQLSALGQARP
jgi:pyridoxine kinase